jgi:hypothetical protein
MKKKIKERNKQVIITIHNKASLVLYMSMATISVVGREGGVGRKWLPRHRGSRFERTENLAAK